MQNDAGTREMMGGWKVKEGGVVMRIGYGGATEKCRICCQAVSRLHTEGLGCFVRH